MTSADQAALGDPLEDFWVQGSTPLSASTTASPTTGNAPLTVLVHRLGDRRHRAVHLQLELRRRLGDEHERRIPATRYSAAGTYTATLDRHRLSSSPVNTATSTSDDHGQQQHLAAVGDGVGQPDLRADPADNELHRFGCRRHPAIHLQLELRRQRLVEQHLDGAEPEPHL